MTERSKKQGTKGVLSLVEVFQTCAPKGQGSILSVLASELQSASTPKEKARWVQTALALTPYNANDTKKIKEKKLGLLHDIAKGSSKDAGAALERVRGYVSDPISDVRFDALGVAAEAAQHPEYAEVALVLAGQLRNDPEDMVRYNALFVAAEAAQHSEHVKDALALARGLANDQAPDVRCNALFVAAEAAQHPEHAQAALALARGLANDQNPDIRWDALDVAAAAAQHLEHAGDALVLARDCVEKDPYYGVRAGALRVAAAAARHSEHIKDALALVQDLAKDPNKDVRKLAQSILEVAKPKPEGGKPAAAPAP